MNDPITIAKHPSQAYETLDYKLLRKRGIEHIQLLGSDFWTDYNIHDPGVTLLEALSYAITDLAYRTEFKTVDLLAPPLGAAPNPERLGLFTPRQILTVNPWTTSDYRKLLISVDGVKNAWLLCKQCPCEFPLYAECAKSRLVYSKTEHTVIVKGLFDVLLEFEEEAGSNLNSGKVKQTFSFTTPGGLTTATVEMRFPNWVTLEANKERYRLFRKPGSRVTAVTALFISGNRNDNVDVPVAELARALRRPVYATFEVKFKPDPNLPAEELLTFEDVPLSVWFQSDADRQAFQLPALKALIADSSQSGIVARFLSLVHRGDEVVALASSELHRTRNLAEDFCRVDAVQVMDIGVCADLDLRPESEIEQVLGEAFYQIAQHLAPDIRFYSLNELLAKGRTIEEIFEGPALSNGFIDNEQLQSTQLKRAVYASDIINILMDIDGVVAVRNLTLVRYNADGVREEALSWSVEVPYLHQPRLYIEGSKFLIFKNGLPFLPDRQELSETLNVLTGRGQKGPLPLTEIDRPIPAGKPSDLTSYFPVQYSLPQVYGVGHEGLSSQASPKRKAQANQLKAYLLFFEQILVNYLYQLRNLPELFALDPSIKHTYFSGFIGPSLIRDVDTLLYQGLSESVLDGLAETMTVFLDRRNRFLDHLLANFAEQFSDYALLLYTKETGEQAAAESWIEDKIAFLLEYPVISAGRGRAFDYKDPGTVCVSENLSGFERRIRRILGLDTFAEKFELFEETAFDGAQYERRWRLRDDSGVVLLGSGPPYTAPTVAEAEAKARAAISTVIANILKPERYAIKKEGEEWILNELDAAGEIIGTRKGFSNEADAEKAKTDLLAFAREGIFGSSIFIVEHVLLRPRERPAPGTHNGDPLLPICIPPDCDLCGEEDPYSFRLTIVINGEIGVINRNIALRRFAEQTIRLEAPAHLALKICWISTEQMAAFQQVYCAWLAELAKPEPDPVTLHDRLEALMPVFVNLKSVYPPATLHDCVNGNEGNEVFLGQTII